MATNIRFRISKNWIGSATIAIVFMLISCSKSSVDPITNADKVSISNEGMQDSQEDEIDDISFSQLEAVSKASGRASGVADTRVTCAKISLAASDKQGSIIVNFDSTASAAAPSGCIDAFGNVRKGMIIITWSGKWYVGGASVTITPINYSVNGVIINGQRALANITDPAKSLIIIWLITANHTYKWSDNTTATRTVNKTKTWDIAQGVVTVTQTQNSGSDAASGTDREGRSYSVDITAPVVYTTECAVANKTFLPVSGTEVLTLDGNVALTIDFGSGICDNEFTVAYNGKTDTMMASNAGN